MPLGAIGSSVVGSGIGAVGSLIGGLFGGKKVKVPELKPIDFAKEQQQAIQQNVAAIEPATELAKKTTAAEQSQLEAQLRRAIPGYDQMVQQASQNIGAALKGELPTDVQQQIQRSTAGRALAGGFGGASGFGRALTARDLGLTSLQLQNQGLSQAQNFIQQQRTVGMVNPFSVSSMFITPSQRIGFMQQQQQAQYNRDLAAAQAAAQASPMQQAMQSAITGFAGNIGGTISQYGMSKALMSDYASMLNPSSLYAGTPSAGSPYAGAGATTGSDMSLTGIIPEAG